MTDPSRLPQQDRTSEGMENWQRAATCLLLAVFCLLSLTLVVVWLVEVGTCKNDFEGRCGYALALGLIPFGVTWLASLILGIAIWLLGRGWKGPWAEWLGRLCLIPIWLVVLAPFVMYGRTQWVNGANAHAAYGRDTVSVGITGIDHLADHLSVQNFWVNGYNASRAGKGGGHACCAMLPKHWRPGLTVEVRWHIDNWRDKTYSLHEAMVPVEKYDEPNTLWVHFMREGSVRVVSSIYGVPVDHPDNKHPVRAPIPDKDPWHQYPIGEGDPPFTQVPNAMQETRP